MKKFVSLLSGGLDSPIAAYLMMKKEFSPVFITFLTSDDESQSMKNKVIQIVEKLTEYTNMEVKLQTKKAMGISLFDYSIFSLLF